MVLKKNKIYVILLFILLMDNCFYLVNTDAIHVTGAFAYSDMWLVAFFLYFGWQMIKYIRVRTDSGYGYKYLVALLCVFVFVSAFQQLKLTGQSVNLGIRPQRNYLVVLLSYFPIRKLISLRKIDGQKILSGLMKLGTFAAGVYILQKLLYANIQFLYVATNYRNGSLRMYIETSIVQIAGLMALYYFCKTYKIKYLILYAINFIDIFWVGQGRLEIISFLAASAIGVVLTKEVNRKRLFIVILGIVAVAIFLNTPFADSFWNAVLSAGTASTAQGNTMEIRYLGREMYFQQLTETARTLFLGCGYPNSLYAPAANKAGYNLNINLNDNGIFGFTYIYGIIGLVILLVLFAKMVVQSIHVYKRTNNNFYIMYLCMIAFMAYNVIMWYWYAGGTFILVLFMCILEENVWKIDSNKEEEWLSA